MLSLDPACPALVLGQGELFSHSLSLYNSNGLSAVSLFRVGHSRLQWLLAAQLQSILARQSSRFPDASAER